MPVTEEQISYQMEAAFRMRKSSSTSLLSASHPRYNGSIDPNRTPDGLSSTEANSGSFLRATVQLSIITQTVVTLLYTSSTILRSATENQHEMAQLSHRIDQWVLSLPREFNFRDPVNHGNVLFSRERVLLGFQLCGARMLLGRQCLRSPKQPWRERAEASFARRMGDSCIEAAKTAIDFFPDESNTRYIYDYGPWWCIVHHLMQATSVLLLGLSYPECTSQDGMQLMHYVKKAIRWLQVMEEPTAERACQVAVGALETVSRRCQVNGPHTWRMDSVHGSEVPTQHPVDPDMPMVTSYTPTQSYTPQDAFMASGYPSYGAVSTTPVYSAYQGATVFSENYHMSR